jgi:hypothetical protein
MNGQMYKKAGRPVRKMLPGTERSDNIVTIFLFGIPAKDERAIK